MKREDEHFLSQQEHQLSTLTLLSRVEQGLLLLLFASLLLLWMLKEGPYV